MTFYIAPIVEGQTEAACLERLLQRVWNQLIACPVRLQVLLPSRGKRDALVSPLQVELIAKIDQALSKLNQRLSRDASGLGFVLLLLDAEHDCPAELGPRMLMTAKQVRSDIDIASVVAKRMLENWIVAGASSLAGTNGLADSLPARDHCEVCDGAAWLDEQFRLRDRTRKYRKTVDAEPLVRNMNLQECRAHSPSCDKLCRELESRSARLSAPEASVDSP